MLRSLVGVDGGGERRAVTKLIRFVLVAQQQQGGFVAMAARGDDGALSPFKYLRRRRSPNPVEQIHRIA